jgi:hypothetical protein
MYDAKATADHFDEQRFYAEKKLPKPIFDKSFGMGRIALSCALFGIRRGPRDVAVNANLETFRGGFISYEGPELRQDDAAVLEGLLHLGRKKLVSDYLSFKPREFCASIGWSGDCSKTVKKLRESIERMQRSLLRVCIDGNKGGRFHLVGDFVWEGEEKWGVNLSVTIIRLFEGGTTFLPIAERLQLTDGLQTWLAGFLRAQSDEDSFETKDLLRFSGSRQTVASFGDSLRDTMPVLQAAGVVKGFGFTRGRLRVLR